MYHCLVLMDLLDLIQLGQIYRSSEVARRLGSLRETAGGMASWLDGLRHPDGQIPFFNDAAFGITPPPGQSWITPTAWEPPPASSTAPSSSLTPPAISR